MDIPQDLDDYIKESIDYTLGLPVSSKTLELKLQASEDARRRLQDQYFLLHSRLKEKDEIIERSRSESSMNAQALKRFIEENQKLALECANLLTQCSRWEKECSLYDHDREALMEFGNEADERAKEAEIRVVEVENDLRRLSEELEFYKHECDMRMGDSSAFCTSLEVHLLDSVITSIIDKDEVLANAHAFLMANSGVESCQGLLKMWERLSRSTQNIIALAAEIKTLQNDKEHLRINLTRAEEEVKVLFEENTILDEENKRLLRQCNKERSHQGSGGKHTGSAAAKGKKRNSSPKMSSSIERKIDFGPDSQRQPLSPLQYNSPNSRMHKK
ncbi:hypothetical protein BVC80_1659g9 [Macleaya cordata]|uniref:Uncharacterized protein n=1 Tax=Macleaya cordata TaxID=56857 RepID=A0A200PZJ2_MACCD|nr:hypothetical protein BVC80_1659g9 [Macleaya cordata]